MSKDGNSSICRFVDSSIGEGACGRGTLSITRGFWRYAVVSVAILIDIAAFADDGNIIVNGSFETVDTTKLGSHGYASKSDAAEGWTLNSKCGIMANGANMGTWWGYGTAFPDGVSALFMQSNNGTPGNFSQTVTVPSNGVYRFSFAYAQRSATGSGQTFTVTLGDEQLFSIVNSAQQFASVSKDTPIAAGSYILSVTGTSTSDRTSDFDDFRMVCISGDFDHVFTPSPTEGGSVSISACPAVPGEEVSVTATPAAGYRFVRWSGDFPAGTDLEQPTVTFTTGTKTVTAMAYFASTAPKYVDGSAESEGDGGADTPFKTIAAALAAIADYETISIRPGTYSISSTIVLDRPVTLSGSGGNFDDVIIDAGLTCRAFRLTHAEAVLQGVTIRCGKDTETGNSVHGGGGAWLTAGTLRNCRVTGSPLVDYTRGAAVYNDGGTVENCTIDGNGGNQPQYWIVYGIGFCQNSGTMRGCTITNNCATYWNCCPGTDCCAAGGWVKGGEFSGNLVAWNGYGRDLTTQINYARYDWSSDNCAAATGLMVSGGEVSDCRVVSNSVSEVLAEYRKIAGVYLRGGAVEDVIVRDNRDWLGLACDVAGSAACAAAVETLLAAQDPYPAPRNRSPPASSLRPKPPATISARRSARSRTDSPCGSRPAPTI